MSMFLAGLAGGVNDAATASRQEEAAKASAQADRENSILLHLAQTHPDDDIRAMALTGLLNQNIGKPHKGMSGFFGSLEKRPELATIRQMMTAGKPAPAPDEQFKETPGGVLPSTQTTPTASMPPGSPVEGGSPSMALPSQPTTPLATSVTPGGPTTVPRQGFMTPAQSASAMEEAQLGTKISVFRHGLATAKTPEEQQLVRAQAGIRTPFTGQFVGNIQRGTQWFRQEAYIDPANGQRSIQEIPIAAPAALQAKPTIKVLAGPDGRPRLTRIMPDNTQQDLGAVPVKDGYVTYTDPDTQQVVSVPAPAVYEKPGGGAAAGPSGAAAAPPPAGGSVSAAPGAPSAATAAAPPPAPSASMGAPSASSGNAAAPPPNAAVTPPRAGGSALPRGVARGRTRSLEPVEGAMLGPDGEPMVTTAQYDKGTGKYYDPAHPGQELTGFIPGKEGQETVKVIANANTVKTTLDRAIQSIKDLKLDQDNDPTTTARLVKEYKEGKAGDNPLEAAFNAMNDFAKIQGASQYVQGTRAFRYISQIQQHLPLLPSYRAAAASALTGGAIGPGIVQGVAGEGAGHQWDSPKQMIEKLELAKQNLDNITTELTKATGKVPARAVGQGGAGAAPAAAAPPAAAYSTPDLTGLAPGHRRTFTTGPFSGTSWTVGTDGKPKQIQ